MRTRELGDIVVDAMGGSGGAGDGLCVEAGGVEGGKVGGE